MYILVNGVSLRRVSVPNNVMTTMRACTFSGLHHFSPRAVNLKSRLHKPFLLRHASLKSM